MGDMAIFTPEIAEELMRQGFKLTHKTAKAWYFEDCELLRQVASDLIDALEWQ